MATNAAMAGAAPPVSTLRRVVIAATVGNVLEYFDFVILRLPARSRSRRCFSLSQTRTHRDPRPSACSLPLARVIQRHLRCPYKLIEPARRDNAPPVFESAAEHRLLGDGLAPAPRRSILLPTDCH
jgi:hypothetical protein